MFSPCALLVVLVLGVCAAQQPQQFVLEDDAPIFEATFAGGDFIHLRDRFSTVIGVKKISLGYTGGWKRNPNYREVCLGFTGHAEAVRVEYRSDLLKYKALVTKFLTEFHDPTQLNQQGGLVGTQYRSAIFTHSNFQKNIVKEVFAEVQKLPKFAKLVTERKDIDNFWPEVLPDFELLRIRNETTSRVMKIAKDMHQGNFKVKSRLNETHAEKVKQRESGEEGDHHHTSEDVHFGVNAFRQDEAVEQWKAAMKNFKERQQKRNKAKARAEAAAGVDSKPRGKKSSDAAIDDDVLPLVKRRDKKVRIVEAEREPVADEVKQEVPKKRKARKEPVADADAPVADKKEEEPQAATKAKKARQAKAEAVVEKAADGSGKADDAEKAAPQAGAADNANAASEKAVVKAEVADKAASNADAADKAVVKADAAEKAEAEPVKAEKSADGELKQNEAVKAEKSADGEKAATGDEPQLKGQAIVAATTAATKQEVAHEGQKAVGEDQ